MDEAIDCGARVGRDKEPDRGVGEVVIASNHLMKLRPSPGIWLLLMGALVAPASWALLQAADPGSDQLAQVRGLLKEARYADAEVRARMLLAQAEARRESSSVEAAQVLDALVEALWRGGKSSAAETRDLAERAVRLKEQALGSEDPGVAASLRNLAIVLEDNHELDSARRTYERTLAIREKAFGPDHPDVARSLRDLANLHSNAGRYSKAREIYERALAIQEKGADSDPLELAGTLNNLAILMRLMGEFEAARPLYERSMAIREKILPHDHPDIAWTLNGLAVLLDQMGDYEAARPLYERALQIREKILGPTHVAVAASLNNLALLLRNTGDYARARSLYERALMIHENALGKNHPHVATSLRNLAALLEDIGDHGAAEPLYERALRIREQALGRDHAEVATVLEDLGGLHARGGDRATARSLYERALAIYEKALGPDHPDVALSLEGLAGLHRAAGDYSAALALLERALRIREKALGPVHPLVAQSLEDLAGLHAALRQFPEARPLSERAVKIRQEVLGNDHPLTARSLFQLAGVLASSGESAHSLELALQAERISREHVLLTLRTLSERQALGYAAARPPALGLALDLLARRSGVAPGRAREVWDAVIRSRALVLDEMAERHGRAAAITRRSGDLVSAQQRLANLRVRGPGREPIEHHRRLLEEARQQMEQAERALAQTSAGFREEQARAGAGLAEIHSALPPRSALLAYVRYGDGESSGRPSPVNRGVVRPAGPEHPGMYLQAAGSYLAFVLSGPDQDIVMVPLGDAGEIERLVRRWSEEAARGSPAGDGAAGEAEVSYRRVGEDLRRAIWDPVVSHLRGVERVLIVPDAALHLVSFAALPAGRNGYLVEAQPVLHYLSAERDLLPRRPPEEPGTGLLAVGGPAFDEVSFFSALSPPQGQRSEQVRVSSYRGERSACADFQTLRFEPLPGTVREAKEIATLWENGLGRPAARAGGAAGPDGRNAVSSVATLVGAKASEAAFKEMAPGRRALHVATHGFFLAGRCQIALDPTRGIGGMSPTSGAESLSPTTADNPLLLSGLVLAGANHRHAAGPEEEDGILTSEEIAALDLSGVEWAVLSACDTGVGAVEAGEGVFGLRRAFRIAGATTLIMSLWAVEDEPARRWMGALYKGRFVKGLATAEAVREASMEILRQRRKDGSSTHPFYWGGFVAAGDWS